MIVPAVKQTPEMHRTVSFWVIESSHVDIETCQKHTICEEQEEG